MRLPQSILLAASAPLLAGAFAPPHATAPSRAVPAPLRAAVETEAERLLRRARELREQVAANEDELHAALLRKKGERDAAADSIIEGLFPPGADGGVAALCGRLRERRLASDALVRVVERLHEREVAARGLEHVEPSVHHGQVTFRRVSQPDEAELSRVRGLVDQLVEAEEVLDREFLERKSERDGVITHSDMMHWGGGNIAGIIKDKVKDLGREHSEQFQKRLESFYEAAKRKHSRGEVERSLWRDDDVWSP